MRHPTIPLLLSLALLATTSCARQPAAADATPAATQEAKPTMSVQHDEHSYAEPETVRIPTLAWTWRWISITGSWPAPPPMH